MLPNDASEIAPKLWTETESIWAVKKLGGLQNEKSELVGKSGSRPVLEALNGVGMYCDGGVTCFPRYALEGQFGSLRQTSEEDLT
jgi:hypothetical protein